MKTRNTISAVVVTAIFTAIFAVGAMAQSVKMKEADFRAEMNAAFTKANAATRRETMRMEKYEDGKLRQESTITEEFVPPGKSRWMSVESLGTYKSSAEWIIIDGVKYGRLATGKWFKDTYYKPPAPWKPSNSPGEATTKYFSEKAKHNGKTVRVIRRVEGGPGSSLSGTYVFRLYLDKTGTILKRENRDTEVGKGNYKTEVTTYEYDETIKIEAPIK